MKLSIRKAEITDAKELLAIYAPYVKNTAITFEYDVPSIDEFANRIQNIITKYPYLAAVNNNEIAGYAYAGAFKGRAAYDWSVETTIYVKENYKKNGIGKALYTELEKVLKAQNILNMNACIAVPEFDDEYLTRNSMKFHEHLGFIPVGEFHNCGYKFNNWYNMIWMEKHIGEHISNPKKIIPFSELTEYH